MDLQAMKRKQLQSLCKKHGIPANLRNKDMADRLSFILKGKENPGTCQSGSDNHETSKGTFHSIGDKVTLDVEINKLNSSHDNNHQMAASDNAAEKADAREVKSVSSLKRSPSTYSEETIRFSPQLQKYSEIKGLESEANLIPGAPGGDVGTCNMEENMQSDVDEIEKQVNDKSHEVLDAAPNAVVMNNVDIVQVASEEFGKDFVEGEVGKLNDNCGVHNHDNVYGTAKCGAEAEKQDTYAVTLPSSQEPSKDAAPEDSIGLFTKPLEASVIEKLEKFDNSLEVLPTAPNDGVTIDVNLLQVSPQDHCVEGEVHKSDDNICVHGGAYNIGNGGSEADTMCPDILIGAGDSSGKPNVTAEEFLNEANSSSLNDSAKTSDQFLPTYPLAEVNSCNLNTNQMITSNADTCIENTVSSQTTGLVLVADPEECIGFSPKHLEASAIKGFEAETNLRPSTLGHETKEELVPTEPQLGETKPCNLNIDQIFASDTSSGDEDVDQGKMELSAKITPVTNSKESFDFPSKIVESPKTKGFQAKTSLTFESCDMKENMQSIKREQAGMFISKETIPKRQALQDLQQK